MINPLPLIVTNYYDDKSGARSFHWVQPMLQQYLLTTATKRHGKFPKSRSS